MKINKLIFGLVFLSAVAGIGYYAWSVQESKSSCKIEDFNYETDAAAVDALFHKGDNWYWMFMGFDEYSIDHMLRYKSPEQYQKRSIMVLKVAKVDGKIAGFLGYHPKSAYVWRLLFLLVDQDFRRQGIAKKLLNFAVEDMIHRGAIRVDLGTRDNNFKSQALYKKFGFKEVGTDPGFVHFSWYKN